MNKTIHKHSKLSYREQNEKGSCQTWRDKVLDLFISNSSESYTDRQVINILAVSDVNLIRPEITRLIQRGNLEENGKTKCFQTNKTVRLTRCVVKENLF